MASKMRGALRTAVSILGATNIAFALIARWCSWWTIVAVYALLNLIFTNGLLIFIVVSFTLESALQIAQLIAHPIQTRHLHLCKLRSRLSIPWQRETRQDGLIQRRRPADYYLFVLGSGGHTKEMLMMMDDGFSDFEHFHRRYLISSGDGMSLNHLEDYEESLRELCEHNGHSPGTYDIRVVHRARRVHQSLLTTPLTAAWSFCHIVSVLLSSPSNASEPSLEFPSLIYSNGPATGFFVALAVHILKVFYLIPEDKCLFVYVESWARISTLSLTGKLLYYLGLADSFAVQHANVASHYGVPNAGPLVFNSRRSVTAAG